MKKLLLSLLILTPTVFTMELSELEYRAGQINQAIFAKERLLYDFIRQTDTVLDVLDRSNPDFEPAIQFIEKCVTKANKKFRKFKQAKENEIHHLINENIDYIKHHGELS